MKQMIRIKITIGVTLLTWSFVPQAFAQPPLEPGHGLKGVSLVPTPLEQEMARFDANQNGKLEPGEMAALRAARAQRRAETIKKWDRNGNGVLEPNELAAARVAWRKAMKAKKQASTPAPAAPSAPKP